MYGLVLIIPGFHRARFINKFNIISGAVIYSDP